MSGPLRNHVEARSSREPARQFVSDTHDHKRDAGRRALPSDDLPDPFRGLGMEALQIYLDVSDLESPSAKVLDATDDLLKAHRARTLIGMKMAAEWLRRELKINQPLPVKLASQVDASAGHLIGMLVFHINRKPRA